MTRHKPATIEKYRAIVAEVNKGLAYDVVAERMGTTKGTVWRAVKSIGALDKKAAQRQSAEPEAAAVPVSGPVASEPSPPAPEQLPLPSPDELDLYAEVARNYLGLQEAVRRAEEEPRDEPLVARLRRDMPPLLKLLKDLRPDPEEKGVRVSPVEMAQYGDAAEAKLRTYAQRSREAMLDLLLQWLGEHPAEEPAVVDCLVHIGILPRGWSAQPEAI